MTTPTTNAEAERIARIKSLAASIAAAAATDNEKCMAETVIELVDALAAAEQERDAARAEAKQLRVYARGAQRKLADAERERDGLRKAANIMRRTLEAVADKGNWREIVLDDDNDFAWDHKNASPYYNGPVHERCQSAIWKADEVLAAPASSPEPPDGSTAKAVEWAGIRPGDIEQPAEQRGGEAEACDHQSVTVNTIHEFARCDKCGATGPVSRHTGDVFWGQEWTHLPSQCNPFASPTAEAARGTVAEGAEKVLLDTVWEFVRVFDFSNGRVPTEKLSFANWHALSKAYHAYVAEIPLPALPPQTQAGDEGGTK